MKEAKVKTDVLVIGAGGAGLRAAITARNQNCDVLVVSKGPYPEGCNSHLAGGGILAAVSENDSEDRYVADTLEAGGDINYPSLVRTMARDSEDRIRDLDGFGLAFEKENDRYKAFANSQCSVPRVMLAGRPYSGDFHQSLVDEVARLSIEVRDKTAVCELVSDADGIVGVIALDCETDTLLAIEAKCVVLASGGAGKLYQFTSNHPSITGDGQVMAFKAGAKLSHLEFMQMRQCIVHPEGLKGMLPPFDGFVSMGGRFYNGRHQRYMKHHFPELAENVTRAEITKLAQLEIMEGRSSPHGGVFGDLSDVPADALGTVDKFLKACRACGFDPSWECYEWSAASHYFMGGVVINPECETAVNGLFAAGEVAAGVQGANRIGGHALTETQVFGNIAGKNAARFALSGAHRPLPREAMDNIRQRLADLLGKSGGCDHRGVRSRITNIISQTIGVVRNCEQLAKASQLLKEIEEKDLPELSLAGKTTFSDVTELFEVENLLLLGQLMAKAAISRTESRGAHQRLDYPEPDNGLKRHFIFQLQQGKSVMSEEKAD